MKIVIIGGVAGGASAAARLRRLDENAEIIILERGEYISYANCGLPYYIGGEITEKTALTLQTPQSFLSRFRIDVRTFSEAVSINRDKKTVSVKRVNEGSFYEESYDKLILSPGAEPVRPPIKGIDNERIFTLRNIPDTLKIDEFIKSKKPKTAVVVGGGYIGVEMAENLIKAGLAVTIIEMAQHLIAPIDVDTACDVQGYLATKGVKVILNNAVTEFEPDDTSLTIKLKDGSVVADMVIMSVGVRPDSSLAEKAGLKLNNKGAIITDDHMLTSDADIYAVGDAVEVKNFVTDEDDFIPLAGPANKQGRIAADNICGLDRAYKGTQGTAILKVFDMTVAATGINEKKAKSLGLDYDKVFLFSGSHAGYYPGATFMSIKVIYENKSGRLLGAQIVGYDGVDKRCDVFAAAIRAKMTAYDLTELEHAYAPPFSSAKDPVNMAGFVIENILTGKVSQYHWHDVEGLQHTEGITLLDVRTDFEYSRGHIENTVHIPLDSLRERINELDNSKPVYVNCQSGLRSYIACRILSQKGFKCYNLAGGYRLYNSVMKNAGFDCSPKHPCGAEKK